MLPQKAHKTTWRRFTPCSHLAMSEPLSRHRSPRDRSWVVIVRSSVHDSWCPFRTTETPGQVPEKEPGELVRPSITETIGTLAGTSSPHGTRPSVVHGGSWVVSYFFLCNENHRHNRFLLRKKGRGSKVRIPCSTRERRTGPLEDNLITVLSHSRKARRWSGNL